MCSANQWIGFYIIGIYVQVENKHRYNMITESEYCKFRSTKYNVSEIFFFFFFAEWWTNRIIYLVFPLEQQIKLEWPYRKFFTHISLKLSWLNWILTGWTLINYDSIFLQWENLHENYLILPTYYSESCRYPRKEER